MVTPVVALVTEHRLTQRMLTVLRLIADRVEAGDPFPSEDVASVLRYLREFCEQVHHQKESAVLYPFVLMVGGDQTAESVGSLVAEHDESKMLLHSLAVFWEPDGLLDAERPAFVELARTYAARLDRHIEREEAMLFPIAHAMPGDEQLHFAEEFDRIGADRRTASEWEVEIVEPLESRYLL